MRKDRPDEEGQTICLSSNPNLRFSECASDRFFQFLGSAERDLLAGLDLNGLAGGGIAAHARGALAHLQDAEAADADTLAFFQMLDDLADETAEDGLRLLFRQLIVFRDARGEMFQCNSCGWFACH